MSFVPRFFLPSVAQGQTEIALDESASHYLVRVLRMTAGGRFTGFDAQERRYELVLKRADPFQAVAQIISGGEKSPADPGILMAIGQSLPKAAKMDWILRQCTELGVNRFIPLVTQRSISRPDASRYGHKKGRWEKIIVEACRQCGRNDIPALDPVTKWEKALGLFAEFDLVLMAYEKNAPTLKTVLESASLAKKVMVLIGPEGGWTKDEVREAEQHGAVSVHLPTPLLRTETAGGAVAAMIRLFFSHRTENETTPNSE